MSIDVCHKGETNWLMQQYKNLENLVSCYKEYFSEGLECHVITKLTLLLDT